MKSPEYCLIPALLLFISVAYNLHVTSPMGSVMKAVLRKGKPAIYKKDGTGKYMLVPVWQWVYFYQFPNTPLAHSFNQ